MGSGGLTGRLRGAESRGRQPGTGATRWWAGTAVGAVRGAGTAVRFSCGSLPARADDPSRLTRRVLEGAGGAKIGRR